MTVQHIIEAFVWVWIVPAIIVLISLGLLSPSSIIGKVMGKLSTLSHVGALHVAMIHLTLLGSS